ncbi:unnamed protein product [Schistocephalus solidus]|uniref:Transmembrane protein n=1 Tax=Schistocephalus solidus TaxID=70667 RepID=A0A183SXS4_SCHSO|nr:unnamed protein product [Schistocephalus solidus]
MRASTIFNSKLFSRDEIPTKMIKGNWLDRRVNIVANKRSFWVLYLSSILVTGIVELGLNLKIYVDFLKITNGLVYGAVPETTLFTILIMSIMRSAFLGLQCVCALYTLRRFSLGLFAFDSVCLLCMLLCDMPLLFLQFSVHGCDDYPISMAFSVKAGVYVLQCALHLTLLIVLLRVLSLGVTIEETSGNPWSGAAIRQSESSMEHTPLKQKDQLLVRSLEAVEGRSGRSAWRSVRGLLCGCVCLNFCIYLLALAATCYQGLNLNGNRENQLWEDYLSDVDIFMPSEEIEGVNSTMTNEWVRLTSVGSVIRNQFEGSPPLVVVDLIEQELAVSTVLKYRNGSRASVSTCWENSSEGGSFMEHKCNDKYHPGDGHDFHQNQTNSKLVTYFRFYYENQTSPRPVRHILYSALRYRRG